MGAIATIPQDCLSLILAWTSPIDAARLACVSRAFAEASRSNITWEYLLPSDYRHILLSANPNPNHNPKHSPSPNPKHSPNPYPNPEDSPSPKPKHSPIPNPKHSPSPNPERCRSPNSDSESDCNGGDLRLVYQRLCCGIFLRDRRERYLLLKRSRGACRILSCSAMDIAWGNDNRFWRWEPSKSSCFSKVAHLIAVCWLNVLGKWECTLPPGKYSVCWRLKVVNPRGGQYHFLAWKRPLRFSLSYLGVALEKKLDLLLLPSNGFEKWFEFEVGQIDVKGKQGSVVELNLEFEIEEIDCSFWKGGLYLDCLALRPSHCDETIYNVQPDKQFASIRRPGVF